MSAGFSKLPANMQRAINANAKLTVSNTRTTKSYSFLGTGISSVKAKLGIYAMAASKLYDVAGGWVVKSNEYVENLNLFTVSMGKYAQEALDYAEKFRIRWALICLNGLGTRAYLCKLLLALALWKIKPIP